MARPRHELALWHTSYTSNGVAITSNHRPAADGAGNVVWSDAGSTISYASNSTSVSVAPAAGASTLVSRADHVHDTISPVVLLGDLSGTRNLDLSTGDEFAGTLVANTTFTFSNPDASGLRDDFVVELTEDATGGWSPTWPGSGSWAGGVTPTHDTVASSVTTYLFRTRDGGASFLGFQAGAGATLAHSSNTYAGTVTLTTPGNTVAITSPSANTLAFEAPFYAEPLLNAAGEFLFGANGDILMAKKRFQ